MLGGGIFGGGGGVSYASILQNIRLDANLDLNESQLVAVNPTQLEIAQKISNEPEISAAIDQLVTFSTGIPVISLIKHKNGSPTQTEFPLRKGVSVMIESIYGDCLQKIIRWWAIAGIAPVILVPYSEYVRYEPDSAWSLWDNKNVDGPSLASLFDGSKRDQSSIDVNGLGDVIVETIEEAAKRVQEELRTQERESVSSSSSSSKQQQRKKSSSPLKMPNATTRQFRSQPPPSTQDSTTGKGAKEGKGNGEGDETEDPDMDPSGEAFDSMVPMVPSPSEGSISIEQRGSGRPVSYVWEWSSEWKRVFNQVSSARKAGKAPKAAAGSSGGASGGGSAGMGKQPTDSNDEEDVYTDDSESWRIIWIALPGKEPNPVNGCLRSDLATLIPAWKELSLSFVEMRDNELRDGHPITYFSHRPQREASARLNQTDIINLGDGADETKVAQILLGLQNINDAVDVQGQGNMMISLEAQRADAHAAPIYGPALDMRTCPDEEAESMYSRSVSDTVRYLHMARDALFDGMEGTMNLGSHRIPVAAPRAGGLRREEWEKSRRQFLIEAVTVLGVPPHMIGLTQHEGRRVDMANTTLLIAQRSKFLQKRLEAALRRIFSLCHEAPLISDILATLRTTGLPKRVSMQLLRVIGRDNPAGIMEIMQGPFFKQVDRLTLFHRLASGAQAFRAKEHQVKAEWAAIQRATSSSREPMQVAWQSNAQMRKRLQRLAEEKARLDEIMTSHISMLAGWSQARLNIRLSTTSSLDLEQLLSIYQTTEVLDDDGLRMKLIEMFNFDVSSAAGPMPIEKSRLDGSHVGHGPPTNPAEGFASVLQAGGRRGGGGDAGARRAAPGSQRGHKQGLPLDDVRQQAIIRGVGLASAAADRGTRGQQTGRGTKRGGGGRGSSRRPTYVTVREHRRKVVPRSTSSVGQGGEPQVIMRRTGASMRPDAHWDGYPGDKEDDGDFLEEDEGPYFEFDPHGGSPSHGSDSVFEDQGGGHPSRRMGAELGKRARMGLAHTEDMEESMGSVGVPVAAGRTQISLPEVMIDDIIEDATK